MNRRTFLGTTAGALVVAPRLALAAARPVPSAAQMRWQREELSLFLHFGVNTFTDREWGDGREDPAIFDPRQLDARQWARVARAAGFRSMVLTAKHHDGFCLWPTATTRHSVAASPFRGGGGDVVREFVDACRAEGLGAGLYCSPWDRNHPAYGDSPRYNAVFRAQLTELLTRYGPLVEVWFDGANGEGPNGRRQVYDWPATFALVRRLQPEAVIFSDAGPDVRWCGNEKGLAGDPNWSTVDPSVVPFPGADGPHIIAALQHGDANGAVWRPAEADTSIRPGWFYHPAQDTAVRTVDNLVQLYHDSVGRNAKLLLNVPPTPAGLLHETDAARLAGMRAGLDRLFATDHAKDARAELSRRGNHATLDVALRAPARISTVRLREDIAHGQVVSGYTVSGLVGGAWRELSRGTTIGYARIDRFDPVLLSRVRVDTEGIEPPRHIGVALFSPAG